MNSRALSLSVPDLGAFFAPSHETLAARLNDADLGSFEHNHDAAQVARLLGSSGLYAYLVPQAHGGAPTGRADSAAYIDVRSLVLIREALAQVSPLADAIFAVQGLGSYPIVLAGTGAQRNGYLPPVLAGERIGAFALTEPEAGSDVAAMATRAEKDSGGWVLDGEKTLISNVPIATHYVVFATTDRSLGHKGITAFLVDSATPGLSAEPLPMSVPHPIGRLLLKGCRIAADAQLGREGEGFKLAMETLDAFRISVGAAANGMAARALGCAVRHVSSRRQFGAPLSDQQIVKAYIADMATELDAARLLVARAAHKRDTKGQRVSVEAAMAKMYATEAAQRIIDHAVQLHGGMGVIEGTPVERLYREIRPLRIYEGTT